MRGRYDRRLAPIVLVAFIISTPGMATAYASGHASTGANTANIASAVTERTPATAGLVRSVAYLAPQDMTATLTPIATNAVAKPIDTATHTPQPTSTPKPRPTKTPRPTNTATPTNTPRPTSTPTPPPVSVAMLSVGVAVLVNGHEHRVRAAALGTTVRLRIVVVVAHASHLGVDVTVTWAIRSTTRTKTFMTYTRTVTLANGRSAVYDDVMLPISGLSVGAYLFEGTIVVGSQVQDRATLLHVTPQVIPLSAPMLVHYAHLHITVPGGWILDRSRDSQGQPVTGPDSLTMYTNTKRAAVTIATVQRPTTPSTDELRALPAQLLDQELSGDATNVKTLTFLSQIDGHDVFAVQGDGPIGSGTSRLIVIVTNKGARLYAFNLINLNISALPSEVRAGLAAIFGVKFD